MLLFQVNVSEDIKELDTFNKYLCNPCRCVNPFIINGFKRTVRVQSLCIRVLELHRYTRK